MLSLLKIEVIENRAFFRPFGEAVKDAEKMKAKRVGNSFPLGR